MPHRRIFPALNHYFFRYITRYKPRYFWYRDTTPHESMPDIHGGVLAPNGKIYGIPDGPYIPEFNPKSGKITNYISIKDPETDELTSYSGFGGVLAYNKKIYCIPYDAASILEFNPTTKKIEFWGGVGEGVQKWAGGVLAYDGNVPKSPPNSGVYGTPYNRLYGIPYNSQEVLEINPLEKTISLFGKEAISSVISLAGDGSRWMGGVLAPNGKIYCIPYNATDILVIDPKTKQLERIKNVNGVEGAWSGGVLAQNGKIHCAPYNSPVGLEIDYLTGTTRTYEILPRVTNPNSPPPFLVLDRLEEFTIPWDPYWPEKWKGCTLSPNGRIYCFPSSGIIPHVLEIDPYTLRCVFIEFGAGYCGGVLANNGIIYAMPESGSDVNVKSIGSKNSVSPYLTSAYLNKF